MSCPGGGVRPDLSGSNWRGSAALLEAAWGDEDTESANVTRSDCGAAADHLWVSESLAANEDRYDPCRRRQG